MNMREHAASVMQTYGHNSDNRQRKAPKPGMRVKLKL